MCTPPQLAKEGHACSLCTYLPSLVPHMLTRHTLLQLMLAADTKRLLVDSGLRSDDLTVDLNASSLTFSPPRQSTIITPPSAVPRSLVGGPIS